MTPNDNRIELIGRIIEEYHVDGVVEMILSGCHATGAESIYIRKFVNEEKNLPYISIDTDYSSADKGQISTRLAAFIEMIQADKSGKKELDMNYCYKLIVSGISGGKCFEEIFAKRNGIILEFRSDFQGEIRKFCMKLERTGHSRCATYSTMNV